MSIRAIISAVPCPRQNSNISSASRTRPTSSPKTMRSVPTVNSRRTGATDPPLRGIHLEFRAVRIHPKPRDFAAQQLLLHVSPILDAQQIGILFAETAARVGALELHAVLELFGQEDHPILEKPLRHRFLAGFTIGIGADL